MTRRIGDVVIIEVEGQSICDDCKKPAECRPYGPNGSSICFECGMKDPEGTMRRMRAILFGSRN